MNDDKALYDFLLEMEQYGIVHILDATSQNNQIVKLIDKIAFMRRTAMG